jgi:hypothetical protein
MDNIEDEIEVFEHTNSGYKTLVLFEAWRVAVLNDSKKTTISGIPYFQKHDLSDEIFVLIKGKCILLTAGKSNEPQKIKSTNMEIGKVYNIKRGTWHTHCLDKETSIMIVENANTGDDNSPVSLITPMQRHCISDLCISSHVHSVKMNK